MSGVTATATTTETSTRVWAVLGDIENWATWLPTVTSVTRVGGGPVGVGSTFVLTQPRLGRAQWRVTHWDPGRGFTWESRRPGVLTTATHQVEARADGGADVVLGVSWTGPGRWLVRALFGRLTDRYVRAEAAALVARVGQAR